MKTFNEQTDCERGKHSQLRNSIGGIRCGVCSKRLNQKQVNAYLLKEIHEDQEQIFKLIGALQVAGLDECGQCGKWSKDFLLIGDRCRCADCMKINPEGILAEDYAEDYEGAKLDVVKFCSGRGWSIKWRGELLETYRQWSKRVA